MGVSIYYSAYRDRRLTGEELARLRETAGDQEELLLRELGGRLPSWKAEGTVPELIETPGELCEGLPVLVDEEPYDPRELFSGSSKVSHSECGMQPMMLQLDFFMQVGLVALRRVLPDAEWRVHIDDQDLTWDEQSGEYRP